MEKEDQRVTAWACVPCVAQRAILTSGRRAAVAPRRFHPNMEWYIDTMITLIERGGEFVTRDVWHSTVQLVGACCYLRPSSHTCLLRLPCTLLTWADITPQQLFRQLCCPALANSCRCCRCCFRCHCRCRCFCPASGRTQQSPGVYPDKILNRGSRSHAAGELPTTRNA
jgi:hypothetical protein